jgi:hypothetical protein
MGYLAATEGADLSSDQALAVFSVPHNSFQKTDIIDKAHFAVKFLFHCHVVTS